MRSLLAILLWLPTIASSATYYVRTNGNDTTGDGSNGNPWQTVTKALSTVSVAGGHTINPTYEQVCQGDTQHAEVILVDFDEMQVTYSQLLDVFFATHDPTTLNRQGNDIGTQYRSVIYYYNEEQKQAAEHTIQTLKDDDLDIVTELSPVPTFYPAEEYHQNY